MVAMATEDYSELQKVATWSPLGRHLVAMVTESYKMHQVGHHLWRPTLANGDLSTLGRVAKYGRHSDLLMQVATSSQFAHGRHLRNGEKDGFHGDLCI